MRDMVSTGAKRASVQPEQPYPYVDGCVPILSKEFGITMTKPRSSNSRILWVSIVHDVVKERTAFSLYVDEDLY